MTKWHTIEAKFSDDEWREILKIMRKKRIKNHSQFVKKIIDEYLGIPIADVTNKKYSGLPSDYRTTYYFYEYVKRMLSSSPRTQKKLEKIFLTWAGGYFSIHSRKHNEKLDEANRLWDLFRMERKVGRPLSKKRKRGRPKDTGI